MVQTLELDNLIQDYFHETLTNFQAVHKESVFFVMHTTFFERVKYTVSHEKSIGIFYSPESYRD